MSPSADWAEEKSRCNHIKSRCNQDEANSIWWVSTLKYVLCKIFFRSLHWTLTLLLFKKVKVGHGGDISNLQRQSNSLTFHQQSRTDSWNRCSLSMCKVTDACICSKWPRQDWASIQKRCCSFLLQVYAHHPFIKSSMQKDFSQDPWLLLKSWRT